MNDIWLPRIHLVAQLMLLIVCGALIGTGHNSVVTDLFCAGGGALLATGSLKVITNKGAGKGTSD